MLGLASITTGLIFTVIVTRSLTQQEFGMWTLINSLFGYVIILEPLISYWATRDIARGIDSGKTALFSSGIMSIGGIIVYVIIAYFVSKQTDLNYNIFLTAASLIPVIFLNRTLTAINLGSKPHAISYGTIMFGIVEIPLASIFIYFLHMGVLGIILTILVSYVSSIIILIIYAKDKIRNKIIWSFFTKWIKLGWLPLYPGIYTIVSVLDVVIFSIFTGSVKGLAFWAVAMVVPTLITQSSFISRAVYPKLLGDNKNEYLKENLIQLFYFSIPLTALVIIFAKPALFVLNPIYTEVYPVVIILSIFVFFNSLSGVFQSFLAGTEKVDVYEQSTFRDYVKSKLFFLPTIMLIQYSVYIVTLSSMLILLRPYHLDPLQLVFYWSIVALGTHFPFTIYLYLLVKKNLKVVLDVHCILKYLLVTVGVFAFVYFLIDKFLIYENNVLVFLSILLIFVSMSIMIYLTITYAIDLRTRKLFKAMIEELRNKIS